MNSWYYMTWEEIRTLRESGVDAVMLPVGATEQHGPQLGCGVDASIAERVCRAVAQQVDVALLPTQAYGCSIGHSRRWPGTIALQPKTLIDVIKDIGDWVYRSGFKRLFIINAHVTNFAPLRCALEMLRAEHDDMMVALINTPEISERVKQAHFCDAEDWHANDAETSLMLAIDDKMVRADKCADSDDEDRTVNSIFSHPVNRTSKNGVTGTPSLATQSKGEELFAWMVEDLCVLVEKGKKEEPPLNHSYFERL
ncbi:creatininase family protein [Aurantivibrio plasticivorans]